MKGKFKAFMFLGVLLFLTGIYMLPLLLASETDETCSLFKEGSIDGIQYLSGGIGVDERAQIEKMARGKYNVKLVFAVAAGNYLGNIPVEIQDKKGNKVLSVEIEGPWFYVNLPRGAYTIKANLDGKVKVHRLTVGKKLQTVAFVW
ncbi:MAG: hypothetical protein HQL03_02905 [Nitrospirae bacterium]|nr:hypothetical protein [Nitrospirota bacterium]